MISPLTPEEVAFQRREILMMSPLSTSGHEHGASSPYGFAMATSPPGSFAMAASPHGSFAAAGGSPPISPAPSMLMETIGPNGEITVGNFDDDLGNHHDAAQQFASQPGDRLQPHPERPIMDCDEEAEGEEEVDEPIAGRFSCVMFSPRCGEEEDVEANDIIDHPAGTRTPPPPEPNNSPAAPPVSLGDFLSPTADATSPMEVTSHPGSPHSIVLNNEEFLVPTLLSNDALLSTPGAMADAIAAAEAAVAAAAVLAASSPPVTTPLEDVTMSPNSVVMDSRGDGDGQEVLAVSAPTTPNDDAEPSEGSEGEERELSPAAVDEPDQGSISPASSAMSDGTKQSKESNNANPIESLVCGSSDECEGEDEEEEKENHDDDCSLDSIALLEMNARKAEEKRVAAEKEAEAKQARLAEELKAKEKEAEEKVAKLKADRRKKQKKVSFIEKNPTALSASSLADEDEDNEDEVGSHTTPRSQGESMAESMLSPRNDDEETLTLDGDEESWRDEDVRHRCQSRAGVTPRHSLDVTPTASRSTAGDTLDTRPSQVLIADDDSEASIMVLMRYMGCTPLAYGDKDAVVTRNGARWLDQGVGLAETPTGREFAFESFDGDDDDNSMLSDDESYATYGSVRSRERQQQEQQEQQHEGELRAAWTFSEEGVEMGLDDLVPLSPGSARSTLSVEDRARDKIKGTKKEKKTKSPKEQDGNEEECEVEGEVDIDKETEIVKKCSKKKPNLTVDTEPAANSGSKKKGKKKKQKAKAPKPVKVEDSSGVPAKGADEEELEPEGERPVPSVFFSGDESDEDKVEDKEEKPAKSRKKVKKATIKEPRKKSSAVDDGETKTKKAAAEVGEALDKAAMAIVRSQKKNKVARAKENVADDSSPVEDVEDANESAAQPPLSTEDIKVEETTAESPGSEEQEKVATALLNKDTLCEKKNNAPSPTSKVVISGIEKVASEKKVKSAKKTATASSKSSKKKKKKKKKAEGTKKEEPQDQAEAVDEDRQPTATAKSSSSRHESPPPTEPEAVAAAPEDIYVATPMAGAAGDPPSSSLSPPPVVVARDKTSLNPENTLAMSMEAESVAADASAVAEAAIAAAEAAIAQSKLMTPRNKHTLSNDASLEKSPSERSDKENSGSERTSRSNSSSSAPRGLTVDTSAPAAAHLSAQTAPAAAVAASSQAALTPGGDAQPPQAKDSSATEVDALLFKTRKWLVRHSESQLEKRKTPTASVVAPPATSSVNERRVMGNITAKTVLNPENGGGAARLQSSVSKAQDPTTTDKASSPVLMNQLLLAKNATGPNATGVSVASLSLSPTPSSGTGARKSIMEQLGEIRAKQRELEKKQQEAKAKLQQA